MISAVVLAAGLSTRMGADNKLLLLYKSKTVIENVVDTLLRAGIKEVIVVTGHEAEQVKTALQHLPVLFAHNPRYAEGMTSSIQQGIIAAGGNGYMICLSDMVTITSAEYKLLEDFFDRKVCENERCICLPHYKNNKGNPVIFSSYYRNSILQNEEQEGCKNIVQANKQHICMLEMDEPHVLQDFDYPDEFNSISAG